MERPNGRRVAPDGTSFTSPSSPGGGGGSPAPERPVAPLCGTSPPLQPAPVPCRQDMAEPEREEEEEEEEGLNKFQGTMKMEHHQALRNTHRGCVILERHRRKRITQSCSELRQLLPTIPGGRVDMVTVLEMTVAYLETIKQVSAHRPDIQRPSPVVNYNSHRTVSHFFCSFWLVALLLRLPTCGLRANHRGESARHQTEAASMHSLKEDAGCREPQQLITRSHFIIDSDAGRMDSHSSMQQQQRQEQQQQQRQEQQQQRQEQQQPPPNRRSTAGPRHTAGAVNCSWGTELWDQFENLEKHTSWGIDFLERYTKFVKERADIELSYAKQIRSLSKKYQAKKNCKEEEESRYSWCRSFGSTLRELNDYASHREALAQNLHTYIVSELVRYTQDLKTERKSHFQDGRRAQQHIENSWKQLESSKRRFERDCKEAERAQQNFDKIDTDNSKADGEKRCSLKARQTAQQKQQAAEDSKQDYMTSLKQFNQDQQQHYHTLVPVIYQRIQDMEERRIDRLGESMRSLAEVERKVLPIISRCLDGMTHAAESVQSRVDSQQVVEVFKTGFEPPGDVEFEDHSAPMRRSISESSYLDNRAERRHSRRNSRGRLWPFIRKNKPPPPPPTSPSPGGETSSPQSPPPSAREPIAQRLNDLMSSGSRTRKQCLRSLKRGGSGSEDFSHLPAEQRRKKLQNRISSIGVEVQREREQRDALAKLREVYQRSPEMGDASSLDSQIEEASQRLDRLQKEMHRHQGWLQETESRLVDHGGRRQSGGCHDTRQQQPGFTRRTSTTTRALLAEKADTEDNTAELHLKSRSSEFDDDFDEDEPLPSQNEGTISMVEGELLSVVEEDKGDGWTRVRRDQDEEGYVPTSYIKVFLDSNAKGFEQSSRLV
ncbi:hypothetical protein CRUP_029738 [Coryphaenoides rupestris]|nr:hypothetical protein CRUP_029738 [Coryphaenoides rupestris]